jgi:hypothetical protein
VEQYEVSWKDYYAVLGVRISAEPEVIRGAYNAMARKYHPDVNPAGATRMKEVNEAYEVLSDPGRKADYDRTWKDRWQRKYGNSGEQYNVSGSRWQERTADADSGGRAEQAGRTTREEPTRSGDSQSEVPQAPSADLVEKLIPWPSLRWQQAALLLSIPLGVIAAVLVPVLWVKIAAVAVSAAGGYVSIKTRLIRHVRGAGGAARIVGVAVVLLMLALVGAAILTTALVLVVVTAVVIAFRLIVVRVLRAR